MGEIKPGTVVVAEYGMNTITKKPFRFLYDMGYYTETGVVVYVHGNKNMQDARFFEEGEVKEASMEDLGKTFWGI